MQASFSFFLSLFRFSFLSTETNVFFYVSVFPLLVCWQLNFPDFLFLIRLDYWIHIDQSDLPSKLYCVSRRTAQLFQWIDSCYRVAYRWIQCPLNAVKCVKCSGLHCDLECIKRFHKRLNQSCLETIIFSPSRCTPPLSSSSRLSSPLYHSLKSPFSI